MRSIFIIKFWLQRSSVRKLVCRRRSYSPGTPAGLSRSASRHIHSARASPPKSADRECPWHDCAGRLRHLKSGHRPAPNAAVRWAAQRFGELLRSQGEAVRAENERSKRSNRGRQGLLAHSVPYYSSPAWGDMTITVRTVLLPILFGCAIRKLGEMAALPRLFLSGTRGLITGANQPSDRLRGA